MIDWYRRKTWTSADEEEFFAKLKRSRDYNRPQYLRVQAIELIETNENYLLEVAEKLLNMLLTDYPENRIEKSPALNALGEIYKSRGDFEKALTYFREALNFEKGFPNVITSAYLNFSGTVIHCRKVDFYNETEDLLTEKLNQRTIIFPFESYVIYSILSFIADYKGNTKDAKVYAKSAEEYANKKNNSLWNPLKQNIGVVTKRQTWLDKLLKR